MQNKPTNQQVRIVKRIVAMAVMLEYACMEMGGVTQDLKQRVNQCRRDAKAIQDFYLRHREMKPEQLSYLKEELLHDNLVLMGEAIDILIQYPEEAMEQVVAGLKESIVEIP